MVMIEPRIPVTMECPNPAMTVTRMVFVKLHFCPFAIRAKGIQWFGIIAWVRAMQKVATIRLIGVWCIDS